VNIDRMNALADLIEAHPDLFDITEWAGPSGTITFGRPEE
jgi:hypothetical protein